MKKILILTLLLLTVASSSHSREVRMGATELSFVIEDVLGALPPRYSNYKMDLHELLLFTSQAESDLYFHTKTRFASPIMQIEYVTVNYLNKHILPKNKELRSIRNHAMSFLGELQSFEELEIEERLKRDIWLEVGYALILYLHRIKNIADLKHLDGMANAYKDYYNTHLGKGSTENFKRKSSAVRSRLNEENQILGN